MRDIIIIGGGPAGASAAIYAARAGRDVLIINKPGSSLEKAHLIENYYGFPQALPGSELLQRGLEQAKNLGAQVIEAEVVGLGFGTSLEVATTAESYQAKAVIIATGLPRQAPNIPGLKEFDGQGISYCAICDGFFCRGREVAVLGRGSYALHEAEDLRPVASSVTLLTNGDPAPENTPDWLRVDTRKVTSLEGDTLLDKVVFEDGEAMPIFRLFVALGSAGSTALARKIGAVTQGNHITVNESMATNVAGLFAAGDCTGSLAQVAQAVADGAKAGINAAKYVREMG